MRHFTLSSSWVRASSVSSLVALTLFTLPFTAHAADPVVSKVQGRTGASGAFVIGKTYPGGQLEVTGTNFATPASSNALVMGDEEPIIATSGSATKLIFVIPGGLEPSKGDAAIRVTVDGDYVFSNTFDLEVAALPTTGGPGNTNTNTNTNQAPKPPGTSNLPCSDQGLEADPSGSGLCLPSNPLGIKDGSLASSTSVGDLIRRILNILLTLGGVVAVFFIVLGGYQYITSRGSEDQAKSGRKTMTYAIVGLIAVLLAFTIVTIVTRTLTTGDLFS